MRLTWTARRRPLPIEAHGSRYPWWFKREPLHGADAAPIEHELGSRIALLHHRQPFPVGTDADADRLSIGSVKSGQGNRPSAAQIDQFHPLTSPSLAEAGDPALAQRRFASTAGVLAQQPVEFWNRFGARPDTSQDHDGQQHQQGEAASWTLLQGWCGQWGTGGTIRL